ncbi:MAG: GNAT family N-acetyltransferase [Candidatus Dormibacteria bacterium]
MTGASTGVALRAAGLADVPTIVAVQAASWRSAYRGIVDEAFLEDIPMAQWVESWRAHFFAGDTMALVAEEGGRVIGFASVGRPDPSENLPTSVAELHTIYMGAAHYGQGIGQLLMTAALDHLRSEGFTEVVLWVLEQNERGRRFYERGGWVTDGASAADCWGATSVARVRYRLTLD